jgi:DNA mismatch repair protein MutS
MVAEHGGQVVFQRKIVPGTADRSYGIHVAQMAGMPPSVVRRAQEVLTVLETHSDQVRARSNSRPDTRPDVAPHVPQPQPVAPPVHPALDRLKAIQIDELTPLEALTKLYELQAMVEDDQV